MYPKQNGLSFDIEYYCNQHINLVKRLLGDAVKGISVEQGIELPGVPAKYVAIGHVLFDSPEAAESALRHLPALQQDIPNYTTIRPILQVSEVKL